MQLKFGTLCIWAIFLALATFSDVLAQVEEDEESDPTIIKKDTIELNDQALIGTDLEGEDSDSVVIFNSRNQKKIPRKAALYAAVLPGLGQIYNGSAWKVPIIYGTFITLGWVATWHQDRYLLFRRASIAVDNNLPEENPLSGNGQRFNLTSGRDQSRRNMEFTYILMAGAYALQIMEAIVDAHLIEFDVSEELSMDMRPSVGQFLSYSGGGGSFVPALGFSFKLKIQ